MQLIVLTGKSRAGDHRSPAFVDIMADSTLVDPRGRTIVLHDHTWFGHIIKRHSDMRTLRAAAERAITNPRTINRSTSDPDCRLYFGSATTSGIMIAVVADVVLGAVKTAYRTARLKGTPE